MKLLKKFFRKILSFILMDLILLLILSYTLKITLVNDLVIETVKQENAISLTNTNNEETNNILNNEVVKELLEKEEVKAFVSDYIDNFFIEISEDSSNFDSSSLQEDMIKYLKEHKEELSKSTQIEITDEKINKAAEEINSIDNKKFLDQNIENIKKSTPKEIKTAIKLINYITSKTLRMLAIILIIIDIIIMIIIDKTLYRWVRSFSVSMIGAGLLSLIISKLIGFIVKSITKITVKTITLYNTGLIILLIGIVLLILYLIIKKILTKEKKDEVSQIS